ncbi:hypothetical protein KU6B_21640 [Mameliella alba]|jgi:hypothetical protein|uniref:Uncharacterized protein n=2 Tax=Rhodobacterales TaxID=204455 RepID=A0A1M6ZT55_9RHOB|nr:hypothetical protein KU6B_21640 [Mameliella alba]GGO54249.1 hypothetical protein GCM10011315_13990 [Roseovarius pacificus]GHG86745.1 hypothetical protein GCM10010961_14600 [Pseudodonghicola xiamenensis]SHL33678.1 hypothetical protein SAMN05444398_10252 [Roseovarius pacificus]
MKCTKMLRKSLMALDFDHLIVELQIRIAVLGGYAALGIPLTEAIG